MKDIKIRVYFNNSIIRVFARVYRFGGEKRYCLFFVDYGVFDDCCFLNLHTRAFYSRKDWTI